jgi:hypothetical protein
LRELQAIQRPTFNNTFSSEVVSLRREISKVAARLDLSEVDSLKELFQFVAGFALSKQTSPKMLRKSW